MCLFIKLAMGQLDLQMIFKYGLPNHIADTLIRKIILHSRLGAGSNYGIHEATADQYLVTELTRSLVTELTKRLMNPYKPLVRSHL